RHDGTLPTSTSRPFVDGRLSGSECSTFSWSCGSRTPARTASSCAATAPPYNTAIAESSDHTNSATIPASGPYDCPNDWLSEKNAPRAAVTTNQRNAATIDPNASHESAGWRRRGDHLKSSVIARVASTTATGHRRMAHVRFTVALLIELPMSCPKARRANAPTTRAPDVTANASAR